MVAMRLKKLTDKCVVALKNGESPKHIIARIMFSCFSVTAGEGFK